ncbi:serine protease FAM111A [Trichomycterus rosablanca]|uniref:serine protease FAM111A n=1 Tax=Trichomycterus rosablanca TaxID=2290929 RepID=UPI002F35168E
MNYFCKEEPEKSRMDEDPPKPKTEDHGHGFKFRYESKVITITCKAPMSLLERLQENFFFKAICKKKQEKKELVIQRSQAPRGAVSPDLPCCLINEDEILKIFFIKSEGNRVTGPRPKLTRSVMTREDLVTFYIRTRGDEHIRKTMRNNELKKTVDYVCVYAFKGEKVKTALKRDGRFVGVVFKNCALSEEGSGNITVMSEPVDLMDGKQFQVIRGKDFQTESQESSQEYSQESETVKTESCEDPGTSHSESTKQESTNGHEKKPQTPQKEKKSKKGPNLKEIPDTQEILKLLRDQFKGLLETLKERENLKTTSGLQKFFREEFNNKVRIFKKVKIIKELMCLSNNVCQIRDDGGVCGTGFLLFDRFILTSAHVVKTDWEGRNVAAVFGFEELQMGVMISLKELVAYRKGLNEMGNYLDFALMELESPNNLELPELLSRCWDPPAGGRGVCIVGHPGEEVKQIDPCFVVDKEAPQNTQSDPCADIRNLFHIMTQQCLEDGYEINDSKIPYSSCFYHGSSGSPVFDEYCKLIGVHTGGYNYQEQGLKKVSVEYALPIFPTLVEIYKQCLLKERSDVIQHFGSHQNLEPVVKRGNELLLNINKKQGAI